MLNFGKFWESFTDGLAKVIAEVRKRVVPGMKTIALMTMSAMFTATTIISAEQGTQYLILVFGSCIFMIVLYVIVSGFVKIDRTRKIRERYR
jgi:hypothetical protein